jgi:hypothetical protein
MITTQPAGGSRNPLLLTVAILLGPCLIAIGSALDPSGTAPPVDAYLTRVAEARPLYLVAGLLMQVGMAAMVVTALALHRLVPALGGGRVLRAGAILIGVWGVFGACGVTAGFTAGWVGVDLPAGTAGSLVDSVFLGVARSPWSTVGAIFGGLGWAVGTVLAGLGLAMTRTHRWAGGVVAASLLIALGIGLGGTSVHRLLAVPHLLFALGLGSAVVRALGQGAKAPRPAALPVVDVVD